MEFMLFAGAVLLAMPVDKILGNYQTAKLEL